MYLFALKNGVIPSGKTGCAKVTGLSGEQLTEFAANWCRENKTDSVFSVSEYTKEMKKMPQKHLSAFVRTYGVLVYIR